MIRILVVDDVDGVRQGIAAFLGSVPELLVVGTCSDGVEVGEAYERFRPDVVLMDVSMPGTDGIAATAALRAGADRVRVLILTSTVDGAAVRRARSAGAVGFLMKSGEPDELVSAVRAAAGGGEWWCDLAAEALRHAD